MPCLWPPAPAQHRPSRGIKFCCITWVGSAEANHPIHAWCNATLRRNINILWTNVHYLTRSSVAFVLVNGGVTQTEIVRHTEATLETSGVRVQKRKKNNAVRGMPDISKPPDWRCPEMNLLCPTSTSLSRQLSEENHKTRRGENRHRGGEKRRVPDNGLFFFVDARPSARSAPFFHHFGVNWAIIFLSTKHIQGWLIRVSLNTILSCINANLKIIKT